MDWTDFASPSGGFNRTDPLLASTLTFSQPLSTSIKAWPEHREDLSKRLHTSEKTSVPFHYDTTPRTGRDIEENRVEQIRTDEKGRVYLEEAFVDFWADLIHGGGWGEWEELTFREANWALVRLSVPGIVGYEADDR